MQFVKPKEVVLPLPSGETLIVKARLNTGEQRERFDRMVSTVNGRPVVDPMKVGHASVLAYLLDWTVTDEGRPVPIRGLSPDELTRVLNNLESEDYRTIIQAIDAHEKAQDALWEAQKKTTPTGAIASSATLPSPSAATGPITTSVN